MIKINIKNKEQFINNIVVSGHSLFADFGSDIVCASVSTLITATINHLLAIEDSIEAVVDEEDAKIQIIVLEITEVNQAMLRSMINMLETLQQDYPTNIKIKED